MPAFWDELFLLKVNAFYWRRLFDSKSSADEMANSLRSTLHAMLEHAVDVVSGAGKDESDSLRQTMSTVARVNALEVR